MIPFVGIVVGIRATVPVGTEQDPLFLFREIASDDISGFQYRSVPCNEVGLLDDDLGAVFLQLCGEVGCASLMSFGIRHAGAEVGLRFDEDEGAVGIKSRDGNFLFGTFFGLPNLMAVGTRDNGDEQEGDRR